MLGFVLVAAARLAYTACPCSGIRPLMNGFSAGVIGKNSVMFQSPYSGCGHKLKARNSVTVLVDAVEWSCHKNTLFELDYSRCFPPVVAVIATIVWNAVSLFNHTIDVFGLHIIYVELN